MSKILTLEISLREVKPKVWRRFLAEDNISFYELHLIIQNVMGWTNSHLYQFVYNHNNFIGNSALLESNEMAEDKDVPISLIFDKPDTKVIYEYDFGDGWIHEVKLLEVNELEKGTYYPVCIKGKGCCPPEDVGGPWGYMEILGVLKGKNTKRKRELVEWIGEEFDPTRFDLDEVNEALQEYRDIDWGFN